MRIGALKSALSLFLKEGRFLVIDKIELSEIKTKVLAGVLSKLQIARKALVVDDKSNENLKLSIRNMEDHQYLPPEGVNVYDLLRHDHLVVSKDAVKALEARCLK
jgi:large subunit ribosomal protein L4